MLHKKANTNEEPLHNSYTICIYAFIYDFKLQISVLHLLSISVNPYWFKFKVANNTNILDFCYIFYP